MKSKLKLFIWTDFGSEYTKGLAFAIARDEADARKLIEEDGGDVFDWGDLDIHPLSERIARSAPGGG